MATFTIKDAFKAQKSIQRAGKSTSTTNTTNDKKEPFAGITFLYLLCS